MAKTKTKEIVMTNELCQGCAWAKQERTQKCNCCRRNINMKDNYRPYSTQLTGHDDDSMTEVGSFAFEDLAFKLKDGVTVSQAMFRLGELELKIRQGELVEHAKLKGFKVFTIYGYPVNDGEKQNMPVLATVVANHIDEVLEYAKSLPRFKDDFCGEGVVHEEYYTDIRR